MTDQVDPKSGSDVESDSRNEVFARSRNAELKPCPFCGSAARIAVGIGRYQVTCTNCVVYTLAAETEYKAIALWNTRAGEAEKTPSENRDI